MGVLVTALRRAFFVALALLAFESAASAQLSLKSDQAAAITSIAQSQGHVPVIVEFASSVTPADIRPTAAVLEPLKAQVASTQDAIISDHFGDAQNPRAGVGFERRIQRFDITPMFAVTVTQAEVESLANDPRVIRIHQNKLNRANLNQSVPLVGMTNPISGAYSLGATGANQAVAIVDTGVQSNHEMLSGKVVKEACFSNGAGGSNRVSLCPNGSTSQSGTGAANSTTAQCINGGSNLCLHGTHVAGIAAGNNTSLTGSEPPYGVAKDAKIVAVQVFTRFNSSSDCSPNPAPCTSAWDSDIVAGLNWIFQNALTPASGVSLASVNMSLGGGSFSSTCDTAPEKAPIDNLLGSGVATIISSGNDHLTSAIGSPGCISSAVTVGSSDKNDTISSFSNMSSVVDIMGPGGFGGGSCTFGANNADILGPGAATSSSTTDAYFCLAGTSMAAPHVAGAFAAIRTACPTKTVAQILTALQNTGVTINDTRSGGSVSRKRIKVDAALGQLSCGGGSGTLVVSSSSNVSASGNQGGPFSPSSFQYQVSASTGSLNYSISGVPSWLNVSATSGSVTTSPTTITFTVNSNANSLGPGAYVATITFTNSSNGQGTTTRSAVLNVAGSGGQYFQGLIPSSGDAGTGANGISSDGTIVVGYSCAASNCTSGQQAVRWNSGGATALGHLTANDRTEAWGVSSNGAIVIGTARTAANNTPQAFRWSGGSLTGLTFLSGHTRSEGTAVNSDGTVIVGNSINTTTNENRAVRWVNGTPTALTMINGSVGDAYAYGVSSDGSVIAGVDFGQAMRWTNGGTQVQALGFLSGHGFSWANGLSSDGSTVVGFSAVSNGSGGTAFRWKNGSMSSLGTLGGSSNALGTNSDGSVVVGQSNGIAFRWTATDGMKSISSLLTAAGFNVTGWTFGTARAVSSDGTVIVGQGYYNSVFAAYVVRLSLPSGGSTSSLQVSSSTNIAASGNQGGPFSPSSFQYQLSASSGSVNYSISGVPNWLNVSSSSGTVTTSATTITFTVNSNANSLGAGTTGPTTITFTNTSNGSGNTTRTATLTVNAQPSTPANDNFANAQTIHLGEAKTGSNVGATSQSGEVAINAGVPSGKTVWWNFLAPSSGPVKITTAGSSFDTILGVYTGNAVNALTFVAANDDTSGVATSEVAFNAVAGTTYRIVVDGYNFTSTTGPQTGNISVGVYDNATPGAASVVSSVSPISRATVVNQTISAYAAIINASSTTTATSCSIALPAGVPATFSYQTTNGSGQPTGSPNTPVNIPANGTQGFFFTLKPTQTMSQEIALIFDCSNTSPAPVFPGINTFSLTAGSSVADMLIATATAPTFGVMDIANRSSASSFTATALNIGPSATLTFVPTDTAIGQLPSGQPLALFICQINPSNAQCINPTSPGSSATVTLNTNQAAYFGVYVIAQGTYIPLDIANNRVYIQAKQSGTPLAQGSVAVRMTSATAPQPASVPVNSVASK